MRIWKRLSAARFISWGAYACLARLLPENGGPEPASPGQRTEAACRLGKTSYFSQGRSWVILLRMHSCSSFLAGFKEEHRSREISGEGRCQSAARKLTGSDVSQCLFLHLPVTSSNYSSPWQRTARANKHEEWAP